MRLRFNEGPVKYFDFKGQAAVDNNDTNNLLSELKKRGFADAEERLAGFRLSFNENSNSNMPTINILAYLFTNNDLGENTKEVSKVRAVDVEFKAEAFFGFFKRFDLLLTNPDIMTENVDVDGPFYDEND